MDTSTSKDPGLVRIRGFRNPSPLLVFLDFESVRYIHYGYVC